MHFLKTIVVTLVMSSSALACPGAMIQFNDSSWLSADGVYGSKGLETSTKDFEEMIKAGKRPVYAMWGKDKVKTHSFELVGSISDEGGVIQAVYLVRDEKTAEVKTVVLKSNYMGNGVRARSIDTPENQLKPRRGFESVLEAGCK